MTIPKLTPFEAIVCENCGLTQYPRPHCARCRRQLGVEYFAIKVPRDLDHACDRQFIASLIHQLRLRRKMSQAALGQASAVNRSIISRLEHGHRASLRVIVRLAVGLGIEEIHFRIGKVGLKSGS